MQTVLFQAGSLQVTPWKIVGYVGVFLFSARWFVQVWVSRRAREPKLPRLFWYFSILGSVLCLLYFIFGKNDSVGVMSNLFPAFVSVYNLVVDIRHRRDSRMRREANAS